MALKRLKISEDGLAAYLEKFPVRHLFSTVKAGNMAPHFGRGGEAERNRRNFFLFFGVEPQREVRIQTEHRDRIAVADSASAGRAIRADAVAAKEPGVVLSLLSADCFPIILTTVGQEFLALIHAGWKETDGEIARKTVEFAAEKFKIKPEDVVAAIGPGAHRCCYGNEAVICALENEPRWKPFATKGAFGPRLDILSANAGQLIGAGLSAENIMAAAECSSCAKAKSDRSHIFFSHCRSGKMNEEEGRMLTLAFL